MKLKRIEFYKTLQETELTVIPLKQGLSFAVRFLESEFGFCRLCSSFSLQSFVVIAKAGIYLTSYANERRSLEKKHCVTSPVNIRCKYNEGVRFDSATLLLKPKID